MTMYMTMNSKPWIAAALAVALVGCGPRAEAADEEASSSSEAAETAQQPAPASAPDSSLARAVAVMRPVGGGEPIGQVVFDREGPGEVLVSTRTEGLEPGRHAHHVHRYGDCRAEDGSAAGPHLPFVEVPEGADPDFITGNLGEVVMPGTGQEAAATSRTVVDLSAIGGLDGIIGRSVIIHRFGNDPSQPPGGDAGARVACGVIGVAEG